MRAGSSWLWPLLLVAPTLALAQQPPPPPPPADPVAPEAREVLRTCREPIFIDCFREWRPGMEKPRPPPVQQGPRLPPPRAQTPPAGEDKADAAKPEDKKPAEKKAPDAAAADKKPPEPKPAAQPPPEPKPDPDLPIYEALLRAIREQGLQDRLHLGGPPRDGAVNLEIAPPKGGYPRPVIRGPNALTAPITDDER